MVTLCFFIELLRFYSVTRDAWFKKKTVLEVNAGGL